MNLLGREPHLALASIAVVAACTIIVLCLLVDAAMLSVPEAWQQSLADLVRRSLLGTTYAHGVPHSWRPASLVLTATALSLEAFCVHVGTRRWRQDSPGPRRRGEWFVFAVGMILGLGFHLARGAQHDLGWWLSHCTFSPLFVYSMGMGLLRAYASAAVGTAYVWLRRRQVM